MRMTLTLHRTARHLTLALIASLTIALSAAAQTRIEPDRNRFTPAQDVELGRRAAAELRNELPIVNDRRTQNYVQRIGERLIAAVPGRLRQSQFRYSFRWSIAATSTRLRCPAARSSSIAACSKRRAATAKSRV
jgi:predicted Zn-dependent protease